MGCVSTSFSKNILFFSEVFFASGHPVPPIVENWAKNNPVETHPIPQTLAACVRGINSSVEQASKVSCFNQPDVTGRHPTVTITGFELYHVLDVLQLFLGDY